MEAGELADLTDFEHWLRDCGSRVHLAAVPLDFYGSDWIGKTRYIDFQEGKEGNPDYILWIGVNGPQEATDLLVSLGVTPEGNLDRLARAGMLVADS